MTREDELVALLQNYRRVAAGAFPFMLKGFEGMPQLQETSKLVWVKLELEADRLGLECITARKQEEAQG